MTDGHCGYGLLEVKQISKHTHDRKKIVDIARFASPPAHCPTIAIALHCCTTNVHCKTALFSYPSFRNMSLLFHFIGILDVYIFSIHCSISCPLVVAFYQHSWGHYLLVISVKHLSFDNIFISSFLSASCSLKCGQYLFRPV